jgi:hypothetical protein
MSPINTGFWLSSSVLIGEICESTFLFVFISSLSSSPCSLCPLWLNSSGVRHGGNYRETG